MSQTVTAARKELLWLGCKEKRCCSYYSVMPTGKDIWQISRIMQLPLWSFTRYTDAPPDVADGFSLNHSDKRYRVVLAKRHIEGQELTTCVFLWRLPDGHAQCGLGVQRPIVCRSYPSTFINGILCVGVSEGCSCRTWSLSDVEIEPETKLVQRLDHDRAEYSTIVQQWNERVQRSAPGKEYDYLAFCNYLVNMYAERYSEAYL